MAIVHFEDVTVSAGSFTGYASSASIEATQGYSPVRAVGWKGAIGTVPEGAPGGSASFSFSGGAPAFAKDQDPSSGHTVTVGATSDSGGIMTNLSVSVEPNAIATSTVEYQFFTPPSISNGGGSSMGTGSGSSAVGGQLLHGASSGTSSGYIRGEYSASQSYDAIYALGSLCPHFKYRTDGEITLTLEGGDLSGSIAACDAYDCATSALTFSIGSLCGGGASWSETVTGYTTSRGASVDEGGVLSGSMTVTEYF